MKAKYINEDLIDDQGAKAIAGWMDAYHGNPDFEETVFIEEPFSITFTNENEFNRFITVLKRNNVPFEIAEPVTEYLKFSDGVEFDTSGPLRPEQRHDGWYVVGQGMLIPVDSEEDALKYIAKATSRKEFKDYLITGKPKGKATKAWDDYLRRK